MTNRNPTPAARWSAIRQAGARTLQFLRIGFLLAGWLPFAAVAQALLHGDILAHDPSTIVKCDGRYYVFSSGPGLLSKSSANLVDWTAGPPVFANAPPWTTNAVPGFRGYLWAPDVIRVNGQYLLYYAVSTLGSQVSAIGLATNSTLDPAQPAYRWVDRGIVIQSRVGDTFNTIDPGVLLDRQGRLWMVFGSYWTGIKLVQLDPATGLRIQPDSPVTSLAYHPAIEAASLHQRGDYFYLFVNWDACCAGVDSTYHIRVGRSRVITGPYLDRAGVDLLANGGSVVTESTGRFIGPGHAGILNENGTNWFGYHYYDGNDSGTAKLGLGELNWTADGWPALVPDWCAFYPFEVDAREAGGEYGGLLWRGAAVVDEGERGRVLRLSGTNQYVTLPDAVANARTVAAWVKWEGGGDWQRIFDFGDGTDRYAYLTPRAGTSGRLRFAITPDLAHQPEQVIDGPGPLPTVAWHHVAVTIESQRGTLYLDGQAVGSRSGAAFAPWQVMARTNYLGRSQWPDPDFRGRLDAVRIYGRALAAAEIAQLAGMHPGLAHRWSFDGNASDPLGGAPARLGGSALILDGSLMLDGTAGCRAELPGGLVSSAGAVTVEFWATFGTNQPGARVFDFGTTNGANGRQFLMFCPHTATGTHRFALSTDAGAATLDGAGVLDGRTMQVACVCDPAGRFMGIYTNGVLERSIAMPEIALKNVSRDLAWLGRSLFSGDPWLRGALHEFRVYHQRLTDAEIAASFAAGPDQLGLAVRLEADLIPAGLRLRWPSYALGFRPQFTDDPADPLGWALAPGTPSTVGDAFEWLLPPGPGARYVRLRR